MSLIAKWSVRNRVAVNMFTIVLLVTGFLAAGTRLTRSIFPDVSTNFIQVTVIDPTTSIPEDIERTITIPIEEELADVKGLTKIRSFSQDNVSAIFVEVDSSIENLDPVVAEVQQAVDKTRRDLPQTAEEPVVEKFDVPMPLVTLTISYPPEYDVRQVRAHLDRLKRRLKIVPGVSDVLVDGLTDREVWVELDPYRMQSFNVSFSDVAEALSRKNVNVVGGKLEGPGGERVIRVLGEIRSGTELPEFPIKAVEGSIVLLRDVATVKETSEEETTRGRVNMQPALTFTIVKKKGADAIHTVAKVREVFAQEVKQLPPEFKAMVISDSTKYVNTRIDTVLQNGVQALVVVTLLLLLFLNWRLAILVAIGIPVSFAGSFIVLWATGSSINLLSLFGMIMALGMVVDDAIVITENAYRHMEQGCPTHEAAIKGTSEVMWPVIGSVSTTVAAFLPLIMGEGIIGKFLAIVPVVVISTLCFSLIQAFLVLPSHIADFAKLDQTVSELEARLRQAKGLFSRIWFHCALAYEEVRQSVDRGLGHIISVYTYFLKICLRRRYVVFCVAILSFVGAIAAVGMGIVQFKLFAADFSDRMFIKLEMPPDSSLDQTERAVIRVEEAVARSMKQEDMVALVTRIGARLDPTDQFLEYGTNLAMITVDIDEQNPACSKPSVIERELNKLLGEFPEFSKATAVADSSGPPVGKPVNVQLQGEDFVQLKAMAEEVKKRLAGLKGVTAIEDDFERGKTEFQVRLDEAAAARAKVDTLTVSRALQGAFRGLEAARVRWGNDEVTIRVKMEERFRGDPELMRNFRVMNRDGRLIDLASIAEVRRASGFSRIKRLNQSRLITVSGEVDDRVNTSEKVNKEIAKWVPELQSAFPGCKVSLAGESEDTQKSVGAMGVAAIVALFLIYALLAWISNSFIEPLIIMSVIPFGLIGVILGLIFVGQPLGLMSIMGTIALAGIVVNNAVVFVDFINQYRLDHTKFDPVTGSAEAKRFTPLVRWRSILESGRTRFRPILLTTGTTVAGLLSLAFTTTGQEQFLAPMAQAIVFGLSFAGVLTMILVPCLFAVTDDIRIRVGLRKVEMPALPPRRSPALSEEPVPQGR